MSLDQAMLRAKLRSMFDRVGKKNGHACPETQSNIDPDMHELWIAAEGESYWKKRHATAKENAHDHIIDGARLAEAIAQAKREMAGNEFIAGEGDLYTMTVSLKKPAQPLDKTKLKNALMTEHGMTSEQVDKLYKSCSNTNKPATSIKVTGR